MTYFSKTIASRLAVLTITIFVASESVADCTVGPGLHQSEFNVWMCMKKSSMAIETGAAAPECVRTVAMEARATIQATKTCLKSENNREGLRALAEFSSSWSDVIAAMDDSSGRSGNIALQMKEAQRKLRVVEELL